MSKYKYRYYACLILILIHQLSIGQRNYVPNSVLSSGDWFKVSINKEGIYKIDYKFLQSLGINVNGLSSASIRLFGNGGQMLPEKVSSFVIDDLAENALLVVDGNDGIFNQNDYFLFYAPGSDRWIADTAAQKFRHQKNLYSEEAFYFITTGGTGKRIQSSIVSTEVFKKADSYDGRYFYEADDRNLLSSGKSWFGQSFKTTSGGVSRQTFPVVSNDLVPGAPASVVSNCIARSVGASSTFKLSMQEKELLQQTVEGVTASSYDLFARVVETSTVFYPAAMTSITYEFTSAAPGAEGWLDWFEIFTRRRLVLGETSTLFFRDWRTVKKNDTVEFSLTGATAATKVWDVTDPLQPVNMGGTYRDNVFSFKNDCSVLREYAAFNASFATPKAIGKVANQNLHGADASPYIIIVYPAFLREAYRLATFHQQTNGLNATIVTIDQVYNEFASGSPDPTAIRNFVKMFHDLASGDSSKLPKYLLLFGDASFDYKNRVKPFNNFIPAYQSVQSLDPLSTYTSDDYFGFLEDAEDINDAGVRNLLDIGIGRIPANTLKQAKSYVDKVIKYKDSSTLGRWRNEISFIADDEDFNLHLQDAETVSQAAGATNPLFNHHKIYMDAFRQENLAAGSRYPLVNKAVETKVESGTLILNYNGHGGFRRLAEEIVLEEAILDDWQNGSRLPLFITATCDFAPYDNPLAHSLGENILLRPETGAIALMTTTRLVFAFSNRIINQQYLETALARKPDGNYKTLGEAVQAAKNNTYQSFTDIVNTRKFTLLGDPALTLNYPRYQVATMEINNKAPGASPDTLKALEKVAVKGGITDHNGELLRNFNGVLHTSVFDKSTNKPTLANDPSSLKVTFPVQERLIFQGRTTITNGQFNFDFLVPKDINYQPGNGRISYYAENGKDDANGSFTGLIIAGSTMPGNDKTGPEINAWINDRSFKNGQKVNEAPILLVELTDSSGINITRETVGHEMIAVLDGDM